MTSITDEDIEPIERALAAGPTAAPWHQEPNGHIVWGDDLMCIVDADGPETAAFVAACSPDRISRLLAALKEAQAAEARLARAVELLKMAHPLFPEDLGEAKEIEDFLQEQSK